MVGVVGAVGVVGVASNSRSNCGRSTKLSCWVLVPAGVGQWGSRTSGTSGVTTPATRVETRRGSNGGSSFLKMTSVNDIVFQKVFFSGKGHISIVGFQLGAPQ